MLVLKTIIIICLSAIATQDFKSRAVNWFWFPVLTLALFFLALYSKLLKDVIVSTLVNVCFVCTQLFLISIYFSVKKKQVINITNGLLGWGDILFLLSFTAYLSVMNYCMFYIISLLFVLAAWLIALLFNKNDKHIPLAGLQSIMFIGCLIADWISPQIDLLHDDWLMHYLL